MSVWPYAAFCHQLGNSVLYFQETYSIVRKKHVESDTGAVSEICTAYKDAQRSRRVPVGEGKVMVVGVIEMIFVEHALIHFPIAHLFPFHAPPLLLLSQGSGVGEANTVQ